MNKVPPPGTELVPPPGTKILNFPAPEKPRIPPGWTIRKARVTTPEGKTVPLVEGVGDREEQIAFNALRRWKLEQLSERLRLLRERVQSKSSYLASNF